MQNSVLTFESSKNKWKTPESLRCASPQYVYHLTLAIQLLGKIEKSNNWRSSSVKREKEEE
jgi:hypothetical protein